MGLLQAANAPVTARREEAERSEVSAESATTAAVPLSFRSEPIKIPRVFPAISTAKPLKKMGGAGRRAGRGQQLD